MQIRENTGNYGSNSRVRRYRCWKNLMLFFKPKFSLDFNKTSSVFSGGSLNTFWMAIAILPAQCSYKSVCGGVIIVLKTFVRLLSVVHSDKTGKKVQNQGVSVHPSVRT